MHWPINHKTKLCGKFPQIPGIDLSGTVVASHDAQFKKGDQIIVTGHGLGVSQGGGYAEYARVPAQWALPLPKISHWKLRWRLEQPV